jgi:Mg2+/Co2+ transporter CorB
MLDLRRLIRAEGLTSFNVDKLRGLIDEPYFVPEGTALHRQLIQFQANHQRAALVVDEFGDIQGLITLEDILEEIVGDFATDAAETYVDVVPDTQPHSYVVNAGANVRSLNRMMNWNLPVDEATTLNGLILEQLQEIPETGADLQLGDYNVEILQTSDNAINLVRIRSPKISATS